MNQFRITKCIRKSDMPELVYVINTSAGAYIENRISGYGRFITVTVVASSASHADDIRTCLEHG